MRVLGATATALIVSVLLAAAQSPTLDDVVARLDAYLIEYGRRLSELQTSARIVPPLGAR